MAMFVSNVGITIIPPMTGDGLYQLSMVMTGGWFIIVITHRNLFAFMGLISSWDMTGT